MAKTIPSPIHPTFFDDATSVTPNDSTTFTPSVIYVGGAGNVAVITAQGTTVTFVGMLAGSVVPVRVKAVLTTTTATNLVRVF